MNKWKSVPHSLAVIVCCAICSMVWSHGSATAESPAKYMGTGSCSSSNCHGGVKPRKSGNVLQNEYVTWHKYDKHSKAWTVLTSQDSKRIAYHLGIADATRAPECLRCHATYVSDKQRHGESYEIEDGISCESCHGAAEHWLASHTARDATHTDNVKRGMTDLGNASQRAALCLDLSLIHI